MTRRLVLLVCLIGLALPQCAARSSRRATAAEILAELRSAPTPSLESDVGGDAGASPSALTEAEALRLAVARSPVLASRAAAVTVAEARAGASGAWPGSQLRLNDLGTSESSDTLEKFHVALRVHLPNPFAVGPTVDAAEAEIPAARAELEEERWDLRHEVRQAFATAVYGQRRAALFAELATLETEVLRHVREAVERGVDRPSAILGAEVARLDADDAQRRAEANARAALQALERLVGRPVDGIAPIEAGDAGLRCPLVAAPGKTPAADLDDLVLRHPAVRRVEADYARADSLLAAAEARRIPYLDYVQLAWEYDPAPAEHGFLASFSFELPIGAWTGGEVALESARREFAEAELRRTVAERVAKTDAALGRWRRAQARVLLYDEDVAPLVAAAVQQAGEAVAEGVATELEQLDARREALRARLAAVEARYDCHEAWLAAEHTAGAPLTAP